MSLSAVFYFHIRIQCKCLKLKNGLFPPGILQSLQRVYQQNFFQKVNSFCLLRYTLKCFQTFSGHFRSFVGNFLGLFLLSFSLVLAQFQLKFCLNFAVLAQFLLRFCSVFTQFLLNFCSVFAQFLLSFCLVFAQFLLSFCSVFAQFLLSSFSVKTEKS